MLFLALACASSEVPDGYTAMYTQMADGTVDAADPAAFPTAADVYAEKIGDDFEDWEAGSWEWYQDTFGIDVDDPDNAKRLYVIPTQAVPPDANYRIVMSSEAEVPPEGWPLTDVANGITIVDPEGFELGGEWEGTYVPAGTSFTYGIYGIDTGEEVRVAPFRSGVPGASNTSGVYAFQCDVLHPTLGDGNAGVFAHIEQTDDGFLVYDIRATATFTE